LPGIQENISNLQSDQEFLFYVSPNGERKSAIFPNNEKGITHVERMTFDSIEIEDVSIDFSNNKCSFTCREPMGMELAQNIQNLMRGFLIQYSARSIAFFTYGRPQK
jgi:hypothetical protein